MSREIILNKIRQAGLDKVPLPKIPTFPSEKDPIKEFTEVLASSSTVIICEGNDLDKYLSQLIAHKKNVVDGRVHTDITIAPQEINYYVVEAALAVAENGALWIDERFCAERIYPFITQHLIIIIRSDAFVSNMHEAYDRIETDLTGFGLFVAGPSKTADIEQSLVIGAHGARSLTVLIKVTEYE